jgi:hypothetical protein
VRVSSLARITVAASGICLVLAGLSAGSPGAMAGTLTSGVQGLRPAAAYYGTEGGLTGVAATSTSNAWAVGYAGSSTSLKVLMLHWNGKTWSRTTSPSVLTRAGELSAITVVNAKDAWAAGFTGGFNITRRRTLLLHWNGRAWSQVTRPAPIPGFLDAVTATASGGWAVGGVPNGQNWPGALALRLAGTTWSRVRMPDSLQVAGVAITGKNAAWAIGYTEQQSALAHWNGHTWTWRSILPRQDLYELGGIASAPGKSAFTVGHEYPVGRQQVPVSLKLTGSTWKQVPVRAPSISDLNAVTFAPGGTGWAAGSTAGSTLILRWTGKAWTRVASPSDGSIDALDGLGFSSARNGWAVGSSGSQTLILHWNGSRWGAPPPAPTGYETRGALLGVAATSNSSAWAVGYTGSATSAKVLMVHWNGSKWARVSKPAVLGGAGQLTAITVVSAKDAWAVGFTGTYTSQRTLLLHWNGQSWSAVTSPAPIAGALNAVTATANSGWAVGDVHPGGAAYSPLILQLAGDAWSRPATTYGTNENDDVALLGVALTSASSAWAVGNTQATSALAEWNGSTWTSAYSLFPLPTVYEFNGIAAGQGGAMFMVGSRLSGASQVAFSAKLAGTTWQRVTVNAPAGAAVKAVTFAPGGTAWAAGAAGAETLVLRWTGKAWARLSTPGMSGSVNGLGFSAPGYGWAVGTSGSDTFVLHWNGRTWK